MDGFSYHNLFDTKGMEYLIVIAFLILLIPMWYFMQEKSFSRKKISQKLRALSLSNLKIPQGFLYGRNHTWLFMERNGMVKMGLDDLLVHLTGAVRLHIRKHDGETVSKGDVLAELDQEGKRLRILSPLNGRVMGVNMALQEDPSLLNSDPYGNGWIFNINPEQWKEATADMLQSGESETWFNKELSRFKDFISSNGSRYPGNPETVVLQDGGELLPNTLSLMPEECWEDFEKEFCQL